MAERSVITNKLPNRVLLKNIPNPNEATTSSGKWIDGTAAGSATDDRFGFYTIQGVGNMSWQITDEGITIAATTATGRGRAPSAPFENTTTVANINKYGIRVKPSTSYTFSYKAKGVNVLANSTRGSVQLYNSAGAFVTSFSASYIPAGDSDWTDYSVTFTTGVSSCWLVVYPGIFTAGNIMSATFKDFKLDTTTPTTRTTATSRSTATNRVAVRDMGTALRFTGGDTDNVDTGVNVLTNIPSSHTISIWAKPRANGASAAPIYEADPSGSDRFYLQQRASAPTSLTIGLSSWNAELANVVELGKWQHYTVVLDGTTGYFYRNGTLQATQAGITVSIPNSALIIGNNSAKNLSFFGTLDEPRIWNRALTATEIQNLYLYGAVPQDGLVAEYLFDEATGTTAIDTSGNGNDGVISGCTYTTDTPLRPRTSV